MRKETYLDFLIPGLILLVLTLMFWFTNIDIAFEQRFYSPEKGWYLAKNNPWRFLYHNGNTPALLISVVALIVFAVSFFYRKLLLYRKIALFLVLLMIIGPGIVVNKILKDHWGRPRPKQIENFDGELKYLPVLYKGNAGKGKSFPSGHASMGFYLFAPFFCMRKNAKKSALICLFIGIVYGLLMGLGRMIQGGHFASDVIWAGGLIYLIGLILYYLLGLYKKSVS